MIYDPQLIAKVSEGRIIKLASVVRDEYPMNSKATYYVLLDEVSDILLSDSRHRLCFHPFGKIINLYH